ncbi:MAG: NADH-quinone oxidoreductase subunit L, partial [Acidimicrobiia bacterium]
MTNFLLAAAEEEVHGVVAEYTSGFWAEYAWIMLVIPWFAVLGIIFFGKRMKFLGAEIAIAMLAFNTVWATVLFILNITKGVVYEGAVTIAEIGSDLVFELGWVVDGLSIMMYFVVSFVGLVIFIYAVGYMEGDVRVTWFFASFTIFAGSMLVLVGAPNLVQLIVGWEGVGVASYLLIGHYWEQKENSSAGMKAFFTNKVADVGLIIGAIIVGVTIGSFRFSDLSLAAIEHADELSVVAAAAGLLLFFGAMGKSAQFPLHIWLPDAMAGPTPVSALMHAATMVTAGIYLMARTFPLYQNLATDIRPIMVAVGTITLFAMGLLALVADDIKKVLAYSTVSQLGYMMTAVAAGGYTAGVFHLFTHAFFKALLFLGAGSVIHAVHSNNMSDMGGLRKFMPRTYVTFLIGSLALAGIIPFAGFWSKDEILVTLGYEGYNAVMWIAIAGAFVTAFYMTRAVMLTFHGDYKGDGHPHESPPVMTVPLITLAVPAALIGLVNIPGVEFGGAGNFTTWLGMREVIMGDHHPTAPDWGMAAIGLGAAALGILGGLALYARDRATQQERDKFEIPLLYPLLRRKYYLDDAALGLVWLIKAPFAKAVDWINDYIIDGVVNTVGFLTAGLAQLVYGGIDQRGIDLGFNAFAYASGGSGEKLRRLQTGRV